MLGGIIVVGVIASAFGYLFIESLWMAVLVMVATVFFSSFLYIKLCNVLSDTGMGLSEFVKELLKISVVMLILLSPIICFGRIILFEEEVGSPEAIVVAYVLLPVVFLTLVNMVEFSPSVRRLRPVTAHEIIGALEQLENKLNVCIDNIYLLDKGLESNGVNAYQVGLRRFRIFVTKRLLSALKTEELVGVLAHEVAHAQRRHTLKIFLGGILVVVIEIMVALTLLHKTGIVDTLIITFAAAWFIDILLRALNRKFEYEADLIAARIVGKDTMISVLKKINELSRPKEHASKLTEFLSDHPLIEKRIRRLQNTEI